MAHLYSSIITPNASHSLLALVISKLFTQPRSVARVEFRTHQRPTHVKEWQLPPPHPVRSVMRVNLLGLMWVVVGCMCTQYSYSDHFIPCIIYSSKAQQINRCAPCKPPPPQSRSLFSLVLTLNLQMLIKGRVFYDWWFWPRCARSSFLAD
jgi:hypothetical protein